MSQDAGSELAASSQPRPGSDVGPAAAVSVDGSRLDVRYCGKTVLAIGAHPDDLELGVGGTLARLSRVARVVMAVVSVPNELDRRVRESRLAASILGCELEVLMCKLPCRVEDLKTYELVAMLDELTKRLKPALVLSHGASDVHRDHTLVFNASLAIQRLGTFDVLCYHPTTTRPGSFDFHPRIFVDVSSTIDIKMDAIAAHESQFAARGLSIEAFRDQARERGRPLGVSYAEGLEVSRLLLS